MGFLSDFFGNLKRAATKGRISPDVSALGLADLLNVWKNNGKISEATALGMISGWVYACIRAIAEEVANARLKLYQINRDGKREEVMDHDLIDLIGSANDYQTGYELRYLTAAHLEAVGNAYWYLEGVKSESDKPDTIHILNPKNVKVLKTKTFPSAIEGYEYKTEGETKKFQPYEILHFKSPDPLDALVGIGTVQNIPQWIDSDNYATEFNRRFFINGARLSGFLESEKDYTPEQLNLLKTQFQEIYSGLANAYKVATLPKGVKFNPGSENQKDMDFVNLQTMMRDRILAGFRVPRTVLGITDDVNRANAEATNYIFALRTVKPKLQLIESYLNEFLVPRYGDKVYLEFEDIVPENRELTIKEMQAAVGNQPVISVNEARERYFGMPGVENGDSVMSDPARIAVGAPKAQPVRRDVLPKAAAKKLPGVKAKKDLSESIARRAAEKIAAVTKTGENKKVQDMTDEEYGAVYKTFLTRVSPYEKKQLENVLTVNAEVRKQALENLSNVLGKAVKVAALYDSEKAVALLVDLTLENFTDLYKKEGVRAAELIGITDFDPLTPPAKKALKAAIGLMAETYDENTLKQLEEEIGNGIDEGASLADMTDRVNAVFDYADQVRAQTVARTETFRVANEANRTAWKESGVVKDLKWYTADDERVCPYCGPQHGKIVAIDRNFFDKGDTISGSDDSSLLADYGDISAPPLHPNCRCYIRPENISI